jgi:deoxyribodipyrimidine photolyase-related protein
LVTQAAHCTFLLGMRHFAQELRDKGLPLQYHFLQDEQFSDLAEALAHTINIHQPEEVWFVRPGDYRVYESLVNTYKQYDVPFKQLNN